MATYGVARMTARQALGVLRDEGVAEARKGAGVFVREFRPLRRRGIQRLASEQWGNGRSLWSADIENRSLEVDRVSVSEEAAPDRVSAVLDLDGGETVCVRRRRFVLDGKAVLLATSYLPASLVAGSAIEREDTGPGGTRCPRTCPTRSPRPSPASGSGPLRGSAPARGRVRRAWRTSGVAGPDLRSRPPARETHRNGDVFRRCAEGRRALPGRGRSPSSPKLAPRALRGSCAGGGPSCGRPPVGVPGRGWPCRA